MDRSFLSQPEVIAASRQFICIRLTTYEDETEQAFMRSLFVGRSGDVENTTVAILAPDGKTPLTRVGRSTKQLFSDAAAMARSMKEMAGRYATRGEASALPVTLDARIGLDVAASDGQPLVLIVAKEPEMRAELEAKVAALAWSEDFIGKFVYAAAPSFKGLKGVAGAKSAQGTFVIEPDTFGQKGVVAAQVTGSASSVDIAAALRGALNQHHKLTKNMRDHRAQGIQNNIFWDTKLPVTDREEAAVRERTKQAELQQRKR
jgi:hypothetical protein